jgi:hypothetical protein
MASKKNRKYSPHPGSATATQAFEEGGSPLSGQIFRFP